MEDTYKKDMDSRGRYIYLDLLRILAILFVLFNHTSKWGFFLFAQKNPTSFAFWVDLFFTVCCKFAVPTFFAISGALYLNPAKNISLKKWIWKVVYNIGILLGISVLYYLVDIEKKHTSFSAEYFFQTIYSNNHQYHLWFLYAYILFIISMPLLRSFVRGMKRSHYYYLILLHIFYKGILPVAEYLLFSGRITLNSNLKAAWVITDIIIYPLIGYGLHSKAIEIKGIKLLLLWIANLITIAVSSYMTYYQSVVTGVLTEGKSQGFLRCFEILNLLAIWETVRMLFDHYNCSKTTSKIISWLGSASFGVFLIHPFFVNDLFELRRKYFTYIESQFGSESIPMFFAFVFLCSLSGFCVY